VQAELELDPLVNFSAQLGAEEAHNIELNAFGEPVIKIK